VGTLGNLEEDREFKIRYVVLGIVDIIACMSFIVPVLMCYCSMSSACIISHYCSRWTIGLCDACDSTTVVVLKVQTTGK